MSIASTYGTKYVEEIYSIPTSKAAMTPFFRLSEVPIRLAILRLFNFLFF